MDNNSLKVDTYEEALVKFKEDGIRAEHNLRVGRKRAAFVVGGLLALDVGIGTIASSMGMSPAEILQTIGIIFPATSPFLAYGLLKIKDTTKKIKLAKKYQDGSRFDGMSEEEVVSLWNDNIKTR